MHDVNSPNGTFCGIGWLKNCKTMKSLLLSGFRSCSAHSFVFFQNSLKYFGGKLLRMLYMVGPAIPALVDPLARLVLALNLFMCGAGWQRVMKLCCC